MTTQSIAGYRVLRRRTVEARMGIGRSTLYVLEKDPRFPKSIRLGSSAGFMEHEIDAYLLGLMQARGGEPKR